MLGRLSGELTCLVMACSSQAGVGASSAPGRAAAPLLGRLRPARTRYAGTQSPVLQPLLSQILCMHTATHTPIMLWPRCWHVGRCTRSDSSGLFLLRYFACARAECCGNMCFWCDVAHVVTGLWIFSLFQELPLSGGCATALCHGIHDLHSFCHALFSQQHHPEVSLSTAHL